MAKDNHSLASNLSPEADILLLNAENGESRNTVKRIFAVHGMEPAPERRKRIPWKRRHFPSLITKRTRLRALMSSTGSLHDEVDSLAMEGIGHRPP